MNFPAPDDPFPDLLEAWEAALADGDDTECEQILAEFPELAERLCETRECLMALHRLRTGGRNSDTQPQVKSFDRPTHFNGQPEAPPLPSVVERLGRFEILRELGRGGFGVVYVAWDPKLERQIALKVPRAEFLSSDEWRTRFEREARAAARLDHPNVAAVFESGVIGPLCYLAATYCPGPDLAQWLHEHGGRLGWCDAVSIVLRLAEAVQHAHARRVLHRDLKPANVLMVSVAGTESPPPGSCQLTCGNFVPRLTDFGLARIYSDAAHQTHDSSVLGTPAFMAPEQASGDTSRCSNATDIYSLGAILYQLLTGRAPFEGASPLEVLHLVQGHTVAPPRKQFPGLPADVETVCLKCLEKEPTRRYVSAEELAADLRRLLDGQPIRARRVSGWEHCWRLYRRRPVVSAIATCLLAVLVIATAIVWSLNRDLDDQMRRLDGQRQTMMRLAEATRRADEQSDEDRQLLSAEARRHISLLAAEARKIGEERQIQIAQQGADFLRRCRQRDGNFADWQTDAARGFLSAGRLLAGMGRKNEASRCARDAADLFELQVGDEAQDPVLQRELVDLYLAQAGLEQMYNRPQAAVAQFARAAELSRDLIEKHQEFVLDQIAYSQALLGQVRMLRRLDQQADALTLVDQQIRDTAWAVAPSAQQGKPPIHADWLKPASGWPTGPSEAQVKNFLALRLAIDISVRARTELAVGHDERGMLLVMCGRLDEAEQEFARAHSIRAPMDTSESAEFQLAAARSHRYKSHWYEATNKKAEALTELQHASRRLQPWIVTRPLWHEMRHEAYIIQLGQIRLTEELMPDQVPKLKRELTIQRIRLTQVFPECSEQWASDTER